MSHQENFFTKLESNDKQVVKDIIQSIRDQFSKVSEPWLLNGLYEYYLSTNSVRSIEILIYLKEPHYQYLFDRLYESLKSSKVELKVQALTLLGHIARSQPSWLYKLPEHVLFKELLRLLHNEVELLPLISALLLLIVLLPMFPSAMGGYLEDIFNIFRRLAAWNSIPGTLVEDQMIHLQVSLYALFLRLYGMYPCNFLTYLRIHFKDKNRAVFEHTIKPMLDTVKMHPSLVTTSKENETTTERWRRMGVHDVIIECERFSLDMTDRCPHDSCQNTTGFRSRSGTANSTIESAYHMQSLKTLASLQMLNNEVDFFTPSNIFHLHTPPITEASAAIPLHIQGASTSSNYQEGTSPPEAAIEATPETTPVRDFRSTPSSLIHHHPLTPKSNAARALTGFRSGSISLSMVSPTHSQPSSPMRKEPSPFTYPTVEGDVSRVPGANISPSAFVKSGAGSFSNQKMVKLIQERLQALDTQVEHPKSKPPPTSPLRIVNPDGSNRQPVSFQRNESPVSQEDEEVSTIVREGAARKQSLRPCDSVLPEFDDLPELDQDNQEQGSPCAAGGLHMPNSKSMNSFKRRIRRFRYHSQCNPDLDRIEISSSSSPGNGLNFPGNTIVRRANSCPEMEKSQVVPIKDNKKPFYETDEETVSADRVESTSNAPNGLNVKEHKKEPPKHMTVTTQTDNFWPMPYEHLFLNIFPSLEASEVKPSPAPSPAPLNTSQEKCQPSLYEILDRYIEKASSAADTKNLNEQLQLLHQQLLFERYRRETHAYRNRRLLSDAKNTRLLAECNSALKDQVQLKQKDIDDLRKQMEDYRADDLDERAKLSSTIQYWEDKFKALQDEYIITKRSYNQLQKDLKETKEQCTALDKEKQDALASLMDAIAEVNVAREQALTGDKVRGELQEANRELLLMGELLIKYKEKLDKLSSKREVEEEMCYVKEAYREEIKALGHQLESKTALIEAYKCRINELEHLIKAKDEIISSGKRTLVAVVDERESIIQAIESKYESQKKINYALEQRIMELLQRLDVEGVKRNVHSPDTSSCHEVQVTTAAGLSPHSSPLSASLGSSEGSVPFHDREVRNLQAFVDQPEASGSRTRMESYGEAASDDRQGGDLSGKTD
ncbi:hamartin isoform X1 [Cylas formicarius]|uniref:hamartin isoform X1 n=1 Tax=Cylas formicarius TaxID=197179 RepID=UPI00295895C4|nr:hamartin isoform X1 [Cylas formicarius]XP_060535654.1 hamartin isoform X1 [Cylas formicarius]